MLKLTDKIKPWSGWLLLAWFLVVIALALIPTPSVVDTKLDIGKIEIRLDYLYHMVVFAAGTLLAGFYSLRPRPVPLTHRSPAKSASARPFSPVVRLILYIGLLLLFAILHEYIQKLIPWRSYNINDVISNLLGVVLGAIITLLFRRRIQNI
jgi:hypothetical protein